MTEFFRIMLRHEACFACCPENEMPVNPRVRDTVPPLRAGMARLNPRLKMRSRCLLCRANSCQVPALKQ